MTLWKQQAIKNLWINKVEYLHFCSSYCIFKIYNTFKTLFSAEQQINQKYISTIERPYLLESTLN